MLYVRLYVRNQLIRTILIAGCAVRKRTLIARATFDHTALLEPFPDLQEQSLVVAFKDADLVAVLRALVPILDVEAGEVGEVIDAEAKQLAAALVDVGDVIEAGSIGAEGAFGMVFEEHVMLGEWRLYKEGEPSALEV
jgi:hypothetical protein